MSALIVVTVACGLLTAVPTLEAASAVDTPKAESLQPMEFPKDNPAAAPAPQRGLDPVPQREALSVPAQPAVEPDLPVSAAPGEEIKSLRTATSKTYATENPSELRVVQFQQPIHFKNTNSNWQQIDERLFVDGDNEAHPRASNREVEIGDDAAAAVLGSVDLGGNRSVSFGLRDGDENSTRFIEGSTATFADAIGTTDVELEVHRSGLKETLVLDSPSAATSYAFDLKTDGVTPRVTGDGAGIEFTDDGRLIGQIPRGFMVDSSASPFTGEGVTSYGVKYSLSSEGSDWRLTVHLDKDWLNDPARVFPVRVDPTVTPIFAMEDTHIQGDSPSGNWAAETQLKVGYCDKNNPYSGGECGSQSFSAYSFLKFDLSSVTHTILSAKIRLWQNWQYDCTLTGTEMRSVPTQWSTSGPTPLTWSNRPADGAILDTQSTKAGRSGCAAAWAEFTVPPANANQWRSGTNSNTGVRLGAPASTGNNMVGWKKFASMNASDSAQWPRLEYTIANNAPNTPVAVGPQTMSWHPTTMPALSATFSDPDPTDKGQIAFRVYNAETGAFVAGWSASTPGNGVVGNVANGATAAWTPPATLPHGLYRWNAHADDYGSVSGVMADRYFGWGPPPQMAKALAPGKSQGTNRGELVWYRLTATNSANTALGVSAITDSFGSGLSVAGALNNISWGGDGFTTSNCASSLVTCTISATDNSLTVALNGAAATLGPGGKTIWVDVPAVLVGDDSRKCDTVANTAALYSSRATVPAYLTANPACETALGREDWFTFVEPDVNAQTWAGVNVANGNLVVQQADTTPVQGIGRIALGTSRTYNSSTNNNLQFPGQFAAGWTLNTSTLGGNLGGVVPAGLKLPSLQSLGSAFAITVLDQDGTRHVFKPKGLSAGVTLTQAKVGPVSIDLANLCVDQSYTAPAGVHLSLIRYFKFPANSSCGSLSGGTLMGFEIVRPDRVRSEYNASGQLMAVRDANGNTLRYSYEGSLLPGLFYSRPTKVWEQTSQCTNGTQVQCRSITFAYRDSSAPFGMDITDPAGRVTKYTTNKSIGFYDTRLDKVENPDGADGAPGSSITYTYGSTCGGNGKQLCSLGDAKAPNTSEPDPDPNPTAPIVTRFHYGTAPSNGPARVDWMQNRRGRATDANNNPTDPTTDPYTTRFTYRTGYTVVDQDGTRQRFDSIDSSGRVGDVYVGGNQPDPADPQKIDPVYPLRRHASYVWDTAGNLCTQPEAKLDNNLCSTTLYSGSTEPDETTRWKYTNEGMPLVETVVTRPALGQSPEETSVTTWGYTTQVATAVTGPPVVFNDVPIGNGAFVSTPGTRNPSNALYTVSDLTYQLTPKGNQLSTPAMEAHRTEFKRDIKTTVVPGAAPAGETCRDPGVSVANTGNLCELVAPGADSASPAAPAFRTTRYVYNAAGQTTEMTSAKAIDELDETLDAADPDDVRLSDAKTKYTYYGANEMDLSGSRFASGWLKAVTEPRSSYTEEPNFVVFAYDSAGNLVRTFDRNATKPFKNSHPVTDTRWGLAQLADSTHVGVPTDRYSEVKYATGDNPYTSPWRFPITTSNAAKEKTSYAYDANGNVLRIRPPKGNPTSGSVSTYDVTYTYDRSDNVASDQTAEQRDTTKFGPDKYRRYFYDPKGNLRAVADAAASPDYQFGANTDPNGHVRVLTYDEANRPISEAWTRAAKTGTIANNFVPSACAQAKAEDAFFPTNRTVCVTRTAYDQADRVPVIADADGQLTWFVHDGAGREKERLVARDTGVWLTTRTAYDANGNVERVCSPRQNDSSELLSTPGECSATANYASHLDYYPSNDVKTVTQYEQGQPLVSRFGYDSNGNLERSTNARGASLGADFFTTTYKYNQLDRNTQTKVPRSTTSAGGVNAIDVRYDASGNVASVKRPDTGHTLYGYDAANRLIETVEGAQDAAGAGTELLSAAAASTPTANSRTVNQYDANGNLVAVYPPNAFTADRSDGDESFMLRKDYNKDNQLTATWSPRYNNTAASGFAPNGSQAQQCAVGAPNYPANIGVCVTNIEYDVLAQPTRVQLPTAGGSTATSRYLTLDYTDDGLVYKETSPDPKEDGVTDRNVTKYAFDGNGREVLAVDDLGRATTQLLTRDGLVSSIASPSGDNERLSQTRSHVTEISYDANGNVRMTTDPEGHRTTFCYYATDRLRRQTVANPKSTIDLVTRQCRKVAQGVEPTIDVDGVNINDGEFNTDYTYDQAGNPATVRSPEDIKNGPASRATTYEFTGDNLLAASFAPTNTSANGPTQWRKTSYTYTSSGQPKTETSAYVGQDKATAVGSDPATTLTYNYSAPNGRLTQKTGWDQSSTIVPTYDANGATLGITSTTSETTTITATRYLDGLVRTWKQSAGSAPLDENKYEYDAAGNRTLRVEFGTSTGTDWKKLSDTTTTFSDAGLPRTVLNTRLPAPTTYRYDHVGNLTGSDMPNGQSDYLKRDPGDDMLEKYIVSSKPGTGDDGQGEGSVGADVITKNTFEYDNNFRQTRNRLAVPAGTVGATGTTQEYDYDDAGRLNLFKLNGTDKSPVWDLNGNRTSYNGTTASYNPDNSNAANTYFPFGGLKADECGTYAYDGFYRESAAPRTGPGCSGNPATATVSDGLGRRWKTTHLSPKLPDDTSPDKTVTNIYGYDGPSSNLARQQLTVETLGTRASSYVLGPDGPMAINDDVGPARTQYLVSNGQGSIATVMGSQPDDQDCTVQYDPFGSFAPGSDSQCAASATNNKLWFASSQREANGTYRFGSRTYQPERAAFTTPDAFHGGGSRANVSIGVDPLTLNRYAYVNGDPINSWDPNGHISCDSLQVGDFGFFKRTCERGVEAVEKVKGAVRKVKEGDIVGAVEDTASILKLAHEQMVDSLGVQAEATYAVAKYAYEHPKETLTFLVGVAVFAGCEAATAPETLGASTFGCTVFAGSVSGAFGSALNCDPESNATQCGKEVAVGTVVGGGIAAATYGAAKLASPLLAKLAPSAEVVDDAASKFGQLEHADEGIKPYRELRKVTAGFRSEKQAHHLIEKRFADVIGGNTDDWLSIVVTKEEHQAFTNAWVREIGKGVGTQEATPRVVEQAARRIYSDYPEILRALNLL